MLLYTDYMNDKQPRSESCVAVLRHPTFAERTGTCQPPKSVIYYYRILSAERRGFCDLSGQQCYDCCVSRSG